MSGRGSNGVLSTVTRRENVTVGETIEQKGKETFDPVAESRGQLTGGCHRSDFWCVQLPVLATAATGGAILSWAFLTRLKKVFANMYMTIQCAGM